MGNGKSKSVHPSPGQGYFLKGITIVQNFKPNLNVFPSHTFLRGENVRFSRWRAENPTAQSDFDIGWEPDDTRKCDLFQKEKFAHIDEYALKAPAGLVQQTFEGVIKYLTKPCQTDLEKVRVIFRWCCTLDPFHTEGMAIQGSVKQCLEFIKIYKYDFTDLFNNLCSCAGLEVTKVTGIGKAVSVGPLGVQFSEGELFAKTSWSAVKINQHWRLISIVGASYEVPVGQNGLQQYHGNWNVLDNDDNGYKRKDDKPVAFCHQINEFFFLTDPEELIYFNFPDDPKWQLLARQVTQQEFMNMASLAFQFFDMNLNIQDAKTLNMAVSAKNTVVKLGIPDQKKNFMYYLWRSEETLVSDANGKHYIELETKGSELWCRLSLPGLGKYKLRLYVQDGKQLEYTPCVTYNLHCTTLA